MTLRSILFVSVAALLVVCAADSAWANDLVISTTTDRQGNGGEFKITGYDSGFTPPHTDVTDLDSGDFNSFCIEFNENITLPGTYDYKHGSKAHAGGVGGGSPDPLGEATAKLFYTFWTAQWDVADTIDGSFGKDWSALTGYDWDNSTDDETTNATDKLSGRGFYGRALQLALWELEDEIDLSSMTGTIADLAKKMVEYAENVEWDDLGRAGWDDGDAGTDDIGHVRVLNLYDKVTGANAQSQLIVVPLPPSALMGFAMLAGLGVTTVVRRRRRNK